MKLTKQQRYYITHKEVLSKKYKEYALNNREAIRERKKIYNQSHAKQKSEAGKRWYSENKERAADQARLRRNKPEAKARKKYLHKIKYASSPEYRFEIKLRSRMYKALKKQKAKKSAIFNSLLGISAQELKIYLASKFYPNKETGEMMTWDNHSYYGWHIDHIKPCKSFDLSKPEQQKECFHYTNLQPLWWKENLSKGGR